MRIVVIIINFIVVGIGLFFLITEGVEGDDWYLILPWVGLPIVNIIALWCTRKDSWLGLYFQRKALEEKKKVEALKSEDEQKQ